MIRASLAALLLSIPVQHTTSSSHDAAIRSTKERVRAHLSKVPGVIDAASKAFQTNCLTDCRDANKKIADKMQIQLDAISAAASEAVDAFLIRTVDLKSPAASSVQVENDLRAVLPEFGEPRVFIGATKAGPYLIAVFGFAISGGDSSITVRAYKWTTRGLALAGVSEKTMNGHAGIQTFRVPTDQPGETCLLLSGFKINANGPRNRMRLYSFDGNTLRTLWMPADAWGDFKITVSDHYFTVTGMYYRDDRLRHDTYVVGDGTITEVRPIK